MGFDGFVCKNTVVVNISITIFYFFHIVKGYSLMLTWGK